MSLEGSCHCGDVRVTLPRQPRTLTACNCSICRRYGALWAYYRADRVKVLRPRGSTRAYAWGSRRLRFVRCARCGCVILWERARPGREARMGVNARLFDPEALGPARIRRLDGARTWKYLD